MAHVRVFVFAPADRTGGSHRLLEESGCDLTLGEASWSTPMGNNEAEICALTAGNDALVGTSIRSSPITRNIMLSSDKLRIVAKYTIGVDDVDVDAAAELGILVTHAPTEQNWGAVAEGTVAAMLALLKRLRERDRHVKAGGWRDEDLTGAYLGARQDGYSGITVGIVGLGRVGSRLADLLRPWKVRILACDPYIPASTFEAHGTQRVDFPTLLRESDVVSLHVVLTPETHHMIGAPELAAMKPSAVLINTSRGAAVEEQALVRALKDGAIRAAALDVFEDEPLGEGGELRHLEDKVLLSPHMISANEGGGLGGLGQGIQWATQDVLKALRGEVPDHVYNKEAVLAWQKRFGGQNVLP